MRIRSGPQTKGTRMYTSAGGHSQSRGGDKSRIGPRVYGTVHGGMPYLRLGSGDPLVFIPGLLPHNEAPVGTVRTIFAAQLEPYARSRRVWWINRRPGLAPDVTMADIARDYAEALRRQFGGPVDVVGESTGGSIALQLAVDHPDVVKRLVIVSAAHRLSRAGAEAQRAVAREVQAGRPRQAAAELMGPLGVSPASRRVLRAVGWLIGRVMYGKATPDLIATINAEDDFSLRDRLHEISAPTLIIGGEKDGYYSEKLFTETAALIPNGRLFLYEGKGHMGASMGPEIVSEVLGFLDEQEADAASANEAPATPANAPVLRIRKPRRRDSDTD